MYCEIGFLLLFSHICIDFVQNIITNLKVNDTTFFFSCLAFIIKNNLKANADFTRC